MKKDIRTREDIVCLVNAFYEKAKQDELIGHLFTTAFNINWEKHLPVMYDFWENTLFYTGKYSGNPIQSHRRLHHAQPLKEEYFRRWTALFSATVDELFEGEKALLAKQRALSIATVMRLKIIQAEKEV
ncbi:MAG: group III truncated hemoglobin [Chitinophagaceae bacterium]|nr:group III truncated hemoglobin [Chitinophagaceae bacterium]